MVSCFSVSNTNIFLSLSDTIKLHSTIWYVIYILAQGHDLRKLGEVNTFFESVSHQYIKIEKLSYKDMYLIQEKTLILDVFSSVHINILCVTFDVSFYAWLHFPFFFRMMKKGLRRKTSVCLINGYQNNIVHASRCKKQSNYTI